MSESNCILPKPYSGAITASPKNLLEDETKDVCVVVVEYGQTDDADQASTFFHQWEHLE